MNATREAICRHGNFKYYSEDRFLGTSLRLYGEWSEDEVRMYDALLTKNDTVIEVGANIGVLTVPLSRRCKHVIAFEPQVENFELLFQNLKTNEVENVQAVSLAIGAFEGEVPMPTLLEMDERDGVIGNYGGPEVGFGSLRVKQVTLDSLDFSDRIAFIKMDCEGSERDVLIGAEKLIARDQPILYMENNRLEKSKALVEWLVFHDYNSFWHRPPLFEVENFRKYHDNIFGDIVSHNLVCYPKKYDGPLFATAESVHV